ncbi:hypothetical protein QC762_0044640 [Podospora pseudocomata]|uniref:Uncharacterized protein n=1 Tax=Podospora pseudocomata TaxID=2093779 RepID=A0ABR0GNT5_9PEZI|nr:hypothetical protein QC762_0044640 [Podospora pseudocomata]
MHFHLSCFLLHYSCSFDCVPARKYHPIDKITGTDFTYTQLSNHLFRSFFFSNTHGGPFRES